MLPQVALWGKGILYHKRFYNLFLTSLASIDSFFSWQNRLVLESCGFEGYLFLNRFGERITTRGIAQQLKHFGEKYGLNRDVVYPHSFRHRFAKNFLDRFNDIALLADLMGHESIETTRIYLRRTASEIQQIVDKVVDW